MQHTYLEIKFNTNRTKKFYYVWLRDNCKCEQCYSAFYNQILHNILDISLSIKPTVCEITADSLKISWEDGHKTKFSLDWLKNIDFPFKTTPQDVLWNNETVPNLREISTPVENYLKGSNGVKDLVTNIMKYGYGIVSGVEPTMEATEEVIKHLAIVQKTHFGEMWKLKFNSECNDTSSTNVGLFPHNDNTYFNNAAGLQVFHLLKRNGEGGKTILVDGFNIANIIKNKNSECFNILSNWALESHFIEKEQHFFFTEPVIKLHPVTKQFHQIRFNIYDRSPLTSLPEEKILKFYGAYQMFGKEVGDDKNQFEIQLSPGNVIFINNWRVLHGRTQYTGTRDMCGSYVARDDFFSKVKFFYQDTH